MSNDPMHNNTERTFAVLAYVLPLIGGLIGLAKNRDNPLTRNHSQQTIAAVLTMFISMVSWIVSGYLIGLIPYVGPVVSVSLFSLVLVIFLVLAIYWLIGLFHAIRGQETKFSIANRLANRLF